jgi:hypothetical protein
VVTLEVAIGGHNDVPIDAVAVALNITVTSPLADGYLTAYPCGDLPPTSNLNYASDQTVPNFVVSALSPDGSVCIDTTAVVDVVVDLAGYVPAGSPLVMLPTPARIVDSRQALGVSTRMPAGQEIQVQVGGVEGVPVDGRLVLFNATVANPSGAGYLTVYPCGEVRPDTSTLNYAVGANVPNFVFAKLGAAGRICLYSYAPTDVIIDMAGYVPAVGADLVPLDSPERLLDTRFGVGGPGGKLTTAGRDLSLAGAGHIPSTASAVIVNLTATQATTDGYVSAFPCGGAVPTVSNLNVTPGLDVANLAIVKLSPDGHLCFATNTAVDVIADVTGYVDGFGGQTFVAVPPLRIYDSRDGVEPLCDLGVRTAGAGVELFHLSTGSSVGAPVPPSGEQATAALLRPDCQAFYVVWWTPGSGPTPPYTLTEVDLAGNVVRTLQLVQPPSNLIATRFGLLNVVQLPSGAEVRGVFDNALLFSLPELTPDAYGQTRSWTPAGATADGSMLAFSYPATDVGGAVVSYFSPLGDPLGQTHTLPFASHVRMSPSGHYLAYDIVASIRPVRPTTDVHVVALDGSPVALSPPVFGSGPWLSDGSIMVCASDGGSTRSAGRWDLFSPVKPLIPPFPGSGCPLTAG